MTAISIIVCVVALWVIYSLIRGLWLPVGAIIAAHLSHYPFFSKLHLKLYDEMMRRRQESGEEDEEEDEDPRRDGVYVPLLIVTPNKRKP